MQAASHFSVYQYLNKLGPAISFAGYAAALKAEKVPNGIRRVFAHLC